MLKNLGLATLALAFACSTVSAQQQIPDLSKQIRTGAWSSLVLGSDSGLQVRAAAPDMNDETLLVFDFYTPTCALKVSFMIPLDTAAEADLVKNNMIVRLQVDSNKAYEGPIRSVLKKGAETGLIIVKQTDQFQSMLTDMMDGLVLRMRILSTEPGLDSVYSLDGFGPTFARAYSMCKDAAVSLKQQ